MTIASLAALLAADLVAISILTLGIYHPRHHRRDMVTAFFGINVGVFAVSAALANSAVGAGLGLGLLGVLSIIRLRSDELSQREVAYYFAALAIGLLGGLSPTPMWIAFAGMALVVAVMFVADSPRLATKSRNELVVVDRAIPDERELRLHLEAMLGGTVKSMHVQRLDLVNDSTWVDVRYVLGSDGAAAARTSTSPSRPVAISPSAPAPFAETRPTTASHQSTSTTGARR